MNEYLKETKEVLNELESNPNGLSTAEAQKRLEKNGKNKLKEPEKDGIVKKFIILFVVIVNTILGMVQESKAEHAIDSLMEMTKSTSKVLRDGIIKNVKSEDLVLRRCYCFRSR